MKNIRMNFPKADAALFKQNDQPIVDVFDRVSFVYCEFLDKKIPILHPGGFRVESGAPFNS